MENEILQRAILQSKVISFFYSCDSAPRYQIVEPHQLERGPDGELILRAWLLDGWSPAGKGWMEYPLRTVAQISVLPNRFLRKEMPELAMA